VNAVQNVVVLLRMAPLTRRVQRKRYSPARLSGKFRMRECINVSMTLHTSDILLTMNACIESSSVDSQGQHGSVVQPTAHSLLHVAADTVVVGRSVLAGRARNRRGLDRACEGDANQQGKSCEQENQSNRESTRGSYDHSSLSHDLPRTAITTIGTPRDLWRRPVE
jgi:hypothetical protein